MTAFQVYLNDDDKEGVRVRVFCDDATLADGRTADWESAFDQCIEALKNGKKRAKQEEPKEGMPAHMRAHFATGREPQL